LTNDLLLIAVGGGRKDGEKEMRKIVQIFDLADSVLDALEGKPVGSTAAQRQPAPSVKSRSVDDTRTVTRTVAPGRALPQRSAGHGAYRIVESHDGGTGEIRHVVTDGHDRAECSSVEFARKVRDALG
jgi:arylsulfatase A-like enzyme